VKKIIIHVCTVVQWKMKVGSGFPTEIQTHFINNTMKTSTSLITERIRKIQKNERKTYSRKMPA